MNATRLEPRVELRTLQPGTVRFDAPSEHCVSIHASAPARVSCRTARSRYLVSRGEISLVTSGAYDECLQDDPSVLLELHLPHSLMRFAAEQLGLDPDARLEPRFCFRDARIEHIAWALEAEHAAGMPSSPLYREGLGLALAGHLLTGYRTLARRSAPGLSRPQLDRVREYVDAHLAADVSLARLSRVAGVSASHFRALFKRAMGSTVHQYIIERRVQRARELLVLNELPASQIALEVGFSHQSHMARAMRKVLGLTPRQLARR